MDIVMPFFLTKGLASMAEDIRKFSLSTILKITKKGGQLLKPHITDLASILIECLSSLEPQVMNYLTFHTEKYNISQDQLDSTRLSATKMSPIMECVESTIDQLDASILEALVPKLANIIRKGMGLPTKAGVARYVVSICSRMPLDLQPHADSLLQALSGVVGDRSAPVRKSFATAVGYICRIASDAALVRFFNHLKKLYLENDDEELRSTSGIVILECSRHANDRMKRFQAEVIPVVYFGCRDTTDAIKETWKLVWDELCGGASTGTTKTFMAEIIDLGGSLLKESPSWQVKRQVGLTFSDLAKLTESAFINHAAQVIPMIIEALSGRTWDGKESVFESLTNVSIICKKWLVELENKALLDEIIKVRVMGV